MKPDQTLFDLQKLVINFASIDRNHYRAKTDAHETDVEHSFAVALLCWYIIDNNQLNLNLEKVLKYALAHDLAEVHAGDVNTFATKEERRQKVIDEEKALLQLAKDLPAFPSLINTASRYESREDDESLFVWTVDKMQALIMGDLDDWRPYEELTITFSEFIDKYAQQLSKSSPHIKVIFESLIDYCKTTYYDQPK